MKISEKDWDTVSISPDILCDCGSICSIGPLYTAWQLFGLEYVVKLFENTDELKVLEDWSYPPSEWEEFRRQVNERKMVIKFVKE